MDPRLPHGRAGDHQLRPRPAEGVPRRARGRRRRHPGRPRRRRHHRRRRPRARSTRTARPTSPRSRRAASTRCGTGGSSNTVQNYFTEHPIYDRDGAPIVVPEWTFPGRGRVQSQLETAQKVMDVAEKALHALPLRGKQAELSAKLEEHRADIDRAAIYVELYGAYVECEAVYARRQAAGAVPVAPRRADQQDVRLRSPGHRLGPLRHVDPPARRSSSTPGCGRPAAGAPRRTASTGCAARCSTRPATSPPSTSRTRSSRRTS